MDMIWDFVYGRYGSRDAQQIIPAIQRVIARAREEGVPVVYLQDAHHPDDRELTVWGEHAMEGSRGSQIIDELRPAGEDTVIKKRHFSGFVNTNLEEVLRRKNASHLVFTGVSTDICVQNNVAEAYFRGFDTTVVEDATASITPEAHSYALEYMRRVYGARIVNSRGEIF
ncbi:MAG: isochorismatase family cysteine hydrolase [Mariprofundales bacterium]|nr:isochorismatase family cysteine hydrolase [Mariprofundales bacterium]